MIAKMTKILQWPVDFIATEIKGREITGFGAKDGHLYYWSTDEEGMYGMSTTRAIGSYTKVVATGEEFDSNKWEPYLMCQDGSFVWHLLVGNP